MYVYVYIYIYIYWSRSCGAGSVVSLDTPIVAFSIDAVNSSCSPSRSHLARDLVANRMQACLLESACQLLSVSLSASIEAACQSQRVVRTTFRAVSCVAHLLRNVCLSVFASQRVSVCLSARDSGRLVVFCFATFVCMSTCEWSQLRSRDRNRHF